MKIPTLTSGYFFVYDTSVFLRLILTSANESVVTLLPNVPILTKILTHKSKAQHNTLYIVFIICCTLGGYTTPKYVPDLTRATLLRLYTPMQESLGILMLRYVALRLSRAQQRAQHLKYQDVPLLRDVALLMRLSNDYWYESSI
jgi:hypothetical protein